jgi:peptidyl-Lys metalloendopeptidase
MHLSIFICILFSLASTELIATLYQNPSAGPSTVTLELINTARYPVALLRWKLPLDNRFGGNSFSVRYHNITVPYLGPLVKYAEPFLGDYVMISHNSSIKVDVMLQDFYDLSLPGKYDVFFAADILDYVEDQNILKVFPREVKAFTPYLEVMSNSLEIIVVESLTPKPMRVPYPCSNSEINELNTAGSNQQTMIEKALTIINQGDSSTYLEWFGEFTDSRQTIASECISAMTDNSVVKYACDDQSGVYAYVYPNDQSHTIYVCEAFWYAPMVGGYDTKAGTLIHELSHFTNICGTSDYEYGTSRCRNLAITNPNRAVANGDSYEYFCESGW